MVIVGRIVLWSDFSGVEKQNGHQQQVIVHLLKLKMQLLNTLLDITTRLGLTAIIVD
jgi:hypothetical protein